MSTNMLSDKSPPTDPDVSITNCSTQQHSDFFSASTGAGRNMQEIQDLKPSQGHTDTEIASIEDTEPEHQLPEHQAQ